MVYFPNELSSQQKSFPTQVVKIRRSILIPIHPETPLPVGADLPKEYLAGATRCSISPGNGII